MENTTPYRVGDRVRAFHPGKFGVVNEGTVTAVPGQQYRKYRIDFGPLSGGRYWVAAEHMLEILPTEETT